MPLTFRSTPKNHLRGEIVVCQRCFSFYRDTGAVEKKEIDGQIVESEFIPVCPKCFKKMLKTEKKRQYIVSAIGDNIISGDEYEKYKNKKVSEQVFSTTINDGVIKINKIDEIIKILKGNKTFAKTRMFQKLKIKARITNEDIGIQIAKKIKIKQKKVKKNSRK